MMWILTMCAKTIYVCVCACVMCMSFYYYMYIKHEQKYSINGNKYVMLMLCDNVYIIMSICGL